jgi:HAMP domain-containing protein
MTAIRDVVLLMALFGQVAVEKPLRPLLDFAGSDAAQKWQAVNDNVMGGVSDAKKAPARYRDRGARRLRQHRRVGVVGCCVRKSCDRCQPENISASAIQSRKSHACHFAGNS